MTPDEFVYAGLLLLSVPAGYIVTLCKGAVQKQVLCCTIGIIIVLAVCGIHSWHSLITILCNCLIIKLFPRQCHILSFVWCFGYLAFFRTTVYFGIPPPPPLSNAVQLLLTLKMVGVAFEVSDTHKNRKKDGDMTEEERLSKKYNNINPSMVDIFLYGYCYIGLLTGPYYKYRVYEDMIKETRLSIPTIQPMLKRIKAGIFYGASFILCSNFFTIEYAKTEEFYDRSFLYHLFYMVPMFFTFRMRMYSAWVLSECLCMTAGLGVYPTSSKPRSGQGPVDLNALELSEKEEDVEYSYETIHNIGEWGCEFAPTVRDGMRNWNMTVQYWLATYVYRRVHVKSLRTGITMAVSAFWHGVYPGYYLSFLTVPPILMAEDAMLSAFRKKVSTRGQNIYDWIAWFFKMRAFDYMCMGFLLLQFDATVRYWGSIYFIGHILTLVFYTIGTIYNFKMKTDRKSE